MPPEFSFSGVDDGTTNRHSPCACWCHREFLTVGEAARIVAISRAQAYELTVLYRRTAGQQGLPVVEIGHALRVPVAVLRRWSGLTHATPCNRCGHSLREQQAS